MFELLKSLFFNQRRVYTLKPKFEIGDMCLWPGNIDGCDDAVVEITNWFRDVTENDEEIIMYEFTDIYRHIDYSGIEEKDLQLLATNEEMLENVTPYEIETLYQRV
jgi:hypothetical protein